MGGTCITDLDGFYIETLICVCFGLFWLRWGQRVIQRLQNKPESAWKVHVSMPKWPFNSGNLQYSLFIKNLFYRGGK